MEINGVKIGGFWVVAHSIQIVDGIPKIVIERISVVDESGSHIKFADLQRIEPFLKKIPLGFSKDSVKKIPPPQEEPDYIKWQVDNNVKKVHGGRPSEKMKKAVEMLQSKLF